MMGIREVSTAVLTALFLIGAAPLSYGNVDYAASVNVLSVHDSSYDKLTNESKGLFSSYKQIDEMRTSRAIASHLKAKYINVSAATMTMIGSSIEADSARITAQVLNLASDKNSTFERHFKDSSGLILRTIADKGHVKDTAAPSTIVAEKLIFNGGRTLAGWLAAGWGAAGWGRTKLSGLSIRVYVLNKGCIMP